MSELLGRQLVNSEIILDRTREEALNREGGYIFDLDGQENAEDGGTKGKFSVDAEFCGMVLTRLRPLNSDFNLFSRKLDSFYQVCFSVTLTSRLGS